VSRSTVLVIQQCEGMLQIQSDVVD